MTSALIAVLAVVAASDGGLDANHCQQSDGGIAGADAGPCSSAGDDPELLRQLEQALPEKPTSQSMGQKLVQSLNPDLSAIVEADFGVQRRPSQFSSAEDPVLPAQPSERAAGFTVQEIEVAMTAIADPYLKAEVYLTVERLGSLGVEEAMATTTSLPWNLQAKAGTFRSAFGRQNGQHLHVQEFTRRPIINTPFLGDDGMRGPGVQVSWLTPLPIWVTIYGEAFSLRAPELPSEGGTRPPPAGTFGGGGAADLTYATEAKAFVPIGEDWSVLAGVSGAKGISPGLLLPAGGAIGAGRTTWLLGGDVYVKWKPPNVARGYYSFTWQTEAMFRRFEEAGGLAGEWDGGLYSQIVVQFARQWQVGARGEAVGVPSSTVLGRTLHAIASLTFSPSEFARVRGSIEAEKSVSVSGQLAPPVSPDVTFGAWLQLEVSIGAHGAHPF
jgi:hypothetical protein